MTLGVTVVEIFAGSIICGGKTITGAWMFAQNGTSIVGDVYWYGTVPRYDSRLRGWGIDNFNMSLTRSSSRMPSVPFPKIRLL